MLMSLPAIWLCVCLLTGNGPLGHTQGTESLLISLVEPAVSQPQEIKMFNVSNVCCITHYCYYGGL